VISRGTDAFWEAYRDLPAEIKQRARTAYRLWRDNPNHPSLRFKSIHATEPIYSVRIGLGWRAVGIRTGDEMLWFWVGSHADYDTLVARFRRNV
jgi:hypothetical protein